MKQGIEGVAAIIRVAESVNASADECYAAGWMSEFNHFLPEDFHRAAQMYQKAAVKGHLSAQLALGEMHFAGKGGYPMDPAMGFSIIQKLASQGHVDAMIYQGVCHWRGRGVEKNIEAARELWEKAAAMGSADAAMHMAEFLMQEGNSGISKAMPWLEAAAEKGHTEAIGVSGKMCMHGVGVKEDHKRGIELCTRAAKRGHVGSLVTLAHNLLTFGGGVRDNLEALEF